MIIKLCITEVLKMIFYKNNNFDRFNQQLIPLIRPLCWYQEEKPLKHLLCIVCRQAILVSTVKNNSGHFYSHWNTKSTTLIRTTIFKGDMFCTSNFFKLSKWLQYFYIIYSSIFISKKLNALLNTIHIYFLFKKHLKFNNGRNLFLIIQTFIIQWNTLFNKIIYFSFLTFSRTWFVFTKFIVYSSEEYTYYIISVILTMEACSFLSHVIPFWNTDINICK